MISAVNEFLDDLRGGKMTEAPVVKVEQGELQGKVVSSPSGKSFYSFQGIPYARPPLGSLRFKAPQAPESWDGIRDATSEGNISAQIDPLFHKTFIGDENCLFLNVYTPNLDGEFLPVMIFIHGGGFKFGSGSSSMYGADYLVERDVVIVTINYRCGALGFLSLNTPEVPGNAGLKDIVQAVRWVKENIQNFGGNSGNVTVFGESCGGVATSILTASPLTKNLISKAIIQSGTALNSWAWQKHPLENAKNLAKFLGCEADNVDEILDFLTTTTVKDIVEANEKMHPSELFYEKGQNVFCPVIEKEFPGVEPVITEAFIDLLTSGRTAEIPIMLGSTTLEFTLGQTPEDLQTFIPEDFNLERNSEESVAIAKRLQKAYFKGAHTGVESLNDYYELLSDKLVNVDTYRYVKYLAQAMNKPIYLYRFDYVGELNVTKKLLASLGLKHAGHMDELGYLFKNDFQSDVVSTPQDIKLRERMLRLWTNFAKSGNPTPDENHFITVTWLPVSKDHVYYLNIGSELSLNTNRDQERMELWDELYSKYYKIWEQPKENNEEAPRRIVNEIVEEMAQAPVHIPEIKEDLVETEQNEEEREIVVEGKVEIVEKRVEVVENNVEVVEEKTEVVIQETVIESEPELPKVPEVIQAEVKQNGLSNGNGVNGNGDIKEAKVRTSNEIKMVQNSNGAPKDVIRASDPPEDDLPKNIGVNKFVNFFESLGGKK